MTFTLTHRPMFRFTKAMDIKAGEVIELIDTYHTVLSVDRGHPNLKLTLLEHDTCNLTLKYINVYGRYWILSDVEAPD